MKKDMHREITVSTLMTEDVYTISPDNSLGEVAELMAKHSFSCLIVAENNKPVGIITERDITRLFALSLNEPTVITNPVAEYMSAPVAAITEQTSLFEALVVTKTRNLRHLPVIDQEGKIVGLITQTDLNRTHFRIIEKQREVIDRSVEDRTQELLEANEELKMLAMEDGLLGIGNRRAMEVDLEHTHHTCLRYGTIYAIALLDIDYFKKYNDTYGHAAGDSALKKVVDIVKAAIRKSDRLYRYGGEEMLLLMPNTTLNGARLLTERLIQLVAEFRIPHCASPLEVITMSAGINALVHDEKAEPQTIIQVIEAADKILYMSKENGRNQLYSSDTAAPQKELNE